jgi:hypothetical protein
MPLVAVDIQAIPNIHTTGALTLVSDSGITRVRIEAEVWNVYPNQGDEYWHFPEGIFVERFDSLLHVEGSLVADTAYHFRKRDFWHAIGNVVIKNTEGTTLETSELFWDQKVPAGAMDAFYSHKDVKMTKANGNVAYGTGFTADQSLNLPRLYSGKGIIFVDESNDALQQNDTISSDTMQLHE